MNDIEKSLLNYNYKNKDTIKAIKIYKRTKKKRIKNKQFQLILSNAVKERKVIKCDDVVLLDIKVYEDLLKDIESKKLELESYINKLENKLSK